MTKKLLGAHQEESVTITSGTYCNSITGIGRESKHKFIIHPALPLESLPPQSPAPPRGAPPL
jgi:hypothetical protein